MYILTSTSVFRDGRISTHADPTSTCHAISRMAHLQHSVQPTRSLNYKQNVALMSVSIDLQARLGSYSSDFGLLGSKVPQNRRFPAQDADERYSAHLRMSRVALWEITSYCYTGVKSGSRPCKILCHQLYPRWRNP